MKSCVRTGISVGVVMVAMASTGHAQGPTGAAIGYTCAGCHGPDGVSQGDIDSLRGLETDYIDQAMKAFRSGDRTGTVMNRIATGYTDEEIRAVAEYFGAME